MKRLLALLLLLLVTALPALAGVNINTASQSELETLPGIGPSKAAAIIEYRSQNGAFASIDQLDDVPGIGPATMNNIRPLVEIGDGQTVVQGEATSSSDSSTASSGGGINVNTASASQLEALPGIGPSKAAAIVADREANGPFPSCDSLSRVRGIGSATVASLRDQCTVE